jgi:ABC-type transporter Mla maintaining outer membrane lipid asymmetry ATPase subunit MlaF
MTSEKTTALEFRNVSISFDDKPALVDISFELAAGEMIFLTGTAGSGKSLVLRLAVGLIKPDAGQIFVDGREMEAFDEAELLAIRGGQEILALDHHDHSADPYFKDPWDKKRRPAEKLL